MFQIGIMRGNNSITAFLIQAVDNGFSDGTSQHRLCTGTEFINQDKGIFIAVSDKIFHVEKMGTIGAQIVIKRLLIANINKYPVEYTGFTSFVNRNKQSTLQHILQKTNRSQADRFASGVTS